MERGGAGRLLSVVHRFGRLKSNGPGCKVRGGEREREKGYEVQKG